jgi:hypothetical protein
MDELENKARLLEESLLIEELLLSKGSLEELLLSVMASEEAPSEASGFVVSIEELL